MPTEYAQKIEFVFNVEQLSAMMLDPNCTGVRVSLGVLKTGEIKMIGDGIKWDGISITMEEVSNPHEPCPVPPGCPTEEECVSRLNNHMPAGITTQGILNFEGINAMFPDL
jgi:hypothetical protein